MNIWTIEGFEGYHSENTSAVVVADNRHEAAYLLEQALAEKGLANAVNNAHFKKLGHGGYDVRILENAGYKQYSQWLIKEAKNTENWLSKKFSTNNTSN